MNRNVSAIAFGIAGLLAVSNASVAAEIWRWYSVEFASPVGLETTSILRTGLATVSTEGQRVGVVFSETNGSPLGAKMILEIGARGEVIGRLMNFYDEPSTVEIQGTFRRQVIAAYSRGVDCTIEEYDLRVGQGLWNARRMTMSRTSDSCL